MVDGNWKGGKVYLLPAKEKSATAEVIHGLSLSRFVSQISSRGERKTRDQDE
jgi:hypothetical protein